MSFWAGLLELRVFRWRFVFSKSDVSFDLLLGLPWFS
jgi:hypothetical protein